MWEPCITELLEESSGLATGVGVQPVMGELNLTVEQQEQANGRLRQEVQTLQRKLMHTPAAPAALGAAAAAPTLSPGKEVSLNMSEDTMATAKKVFHRYDLDDSGTVNNMDEALQMAVHLLFALGYTVTPDEDAIREDLKDRVVENPLDFDEFFAYFTGKFGPAPVPVSF